MKILFLIYYFIIYITILQATNQYLGCFIDQIGNRDLSTFIGEYEQLTPKQCILACQKQHFTYAAIQYGNECRCGEQYGKYGQVSDDQCDYLCLTAEKCGGDYRNSVYDVINSIDIISTESSLLKNLRVKRVVATNERTDTSTYTTEMSSILILMTNSSSFNSNTNIDQSISSISTTMTSTNTPEIFTTTSQLSMSTISTSTFFTISSTSTSSISISQSTINPITTTLSITESTSMYSVLTDTSTTVSTPTSQSSGTSQETSMDISSSINMISTSTSSNMDTTQSISLSSMSESNSSQSTNSISTEISSISSPLVSSNTIVSNNSSNFSSIMTTTSPSSSSIISTIFQENNFESSIPNTSFSTINSFSNNSTNLELQTTIISSSVSTDITVQTTNTNSDITSITITTEIINSTTTITTQETTTTTVALENVITIVLIVPLNFTSYDNVTQELIRTRLINLINLAFQCFTNPSSSNCIEPRQRKKRQCSAGYDVNLVSNITESSFTNSSKNIQVSYTVDSLCDPNTFISPDQVRTVMSSLSSAQITNVLGYPYVGDLSRSISIGTTGNTTTDNKLWLIGAILGPIVFVFLLIFVFCYLHYKCRPRSTNRTLAKVISNVPPISARGTNYQTVVNEPVKDKSISEKNLQIITQNNPLVVNSVTSNQSDTNLHNLISNDPLVGISASTSSRRITSIQSARSMDDIPEYPISMDEIRHQNDVERWRNKLRLQEKFQQSSSIGIQEPSLPNTNRSDPYEYDHSNINLQSTNEMISIHSPRPKSKSTEIEVGRTKLHRLLDEVLDKNENQEFYNPDSDIERLKRRRQRRRINSLSTDERNTPINQQTPHTPVIPQVIERPNSSLVHLHYNHYEAGDRAHDISNLTPVELKPKYITDNQRSTQYSSRSNPPLFYDDLNIVDRAATATDKYANPKRLAKIRLETDREASIRHDGGRINKQREHKLNDDIVYTNSISKNLDEYHVQARTAWVEPELDNNYRNDYLTAKRSIANTRNIISSIHDELHHINLPKSGDYHA